MRSGPAEMFCAISVLSLLLPAPAMSQSVISGLVTESQCRAGCLTDWPPGEDRGHCWATCHHPAHCQQETCGRGCRSACTLLANKTDRPQEPRGPRHLDTPRHLETLQFSRLPSIAGCDLSWGPLEVPPNTMKSSSSSPPAAVYLVVGQDKAGQWYEVTQTVTTSARLEGTMTAKLARLVVLGLTETGLQDTVIMDTDGTNCSQMEMLKRTWEMRNTELKDVSLTPRLVSLGLEEGSSLTEARLAWAGEAGAEYLVQWRRLSSSLDIVGNLVTRQTSVQLSLQTDSLYMVTVREVRQDRVSPDTLINTSVAAPSSSPNTKRISTEVIILLVLTLLAVATVMGLILHSRYADSQEQQQNEFNKQLELERGYDVCLETAGKSTFRLSNIKERFHEKLSNFRISTKEESRV